MEYELNDQDRADLVKNFFKKFGLWIVLAILVVAMGYGVYTYLQNRSQQQNEAASLAYQAILTATQNGATSEQITQSANQLIQTYPRTIYATFSNLILANLAVQQSNLTSAEEILRSTLRENSGNTLAPVITLRLARILIAENKPKEASSILQNPPTGFVSAYGLLSGDAELLENNPTAAKESYVNAKKANKNNLLLNQLLTERLNSLGGNS